MLQRHETGAIRRSCGAFRNHWHYGIDLRKNLYWNFNELRRPSQGAQRR